MQIIYKIEFILMKKIIIFWKKIRFLENKFIFWKFIFLGNKISFFGRKKIFEIFFFNDQKIIFYFQKKKIISKKKLKPPK